MILVLWIWKNIGLSFVVQLKLIYKIIHFFFLLKNFVILTWPPWKESLAQTTYQTYLVLIIECISTVKSWFSYTFLIGWPDLSTWCIVLIIRILKFFSFFLHHEMTVLSLKQGYKNVV